MNGLKLTLFKNVISPDLENTNPHLYQSYLTALSFDGGYALISADELVVKKSNGTEFRSELSFYETDTFSMTETYIGHFENGETFRLLFASDNNPHAETDPMLSFGGMSKSAWAIHYSVNSKVEVIKNISKETGVINDIVENAHNLLKHEYDTPITKYNPYLVNVSHLCITNKEILSMIPDRDAGDVGIAYLYMLDLLDTSKAQIFPTYSTLSFYFMQKCLFLGNDILPSTEYMKILSKLIKLMNIGALSFYRSVARAYNEMPAHYFDVSNLYGLPGYVKKILLLELSYFYDLKSELERNTTYHASGFEMSPEFRNRLGFLRGLEADGYFVEFIGSNTISDTANSIRKRVFEFADKIVSAGEFYFI